MSIDRKRRIERLFKSLDVNQDGSISLSDVLATLSKSKETRNGTTDLIYSKIFMEEADANDDGYVDFDEFVRYVESREGRITFMFHQIDSNGDDVIDIEDVKTMFRRLNIFLNNTEAEKMMKRIDKKGNLTITIDEWRDFLIFHPTQSIEQIGHFWQHGNFVDAGADWVIPEVFEENTKEMSVLAKRLICGGIAGAVSRSCTAPLDRVKVMLQVFGYKHVDSGIIQSMKYMLSEGGVWSLWRGNGLNILKIVPESAIKYSMYEYFKTQFGKDSNTSNSIQSLEKKFLAGSLAGVSAQSVIYPLETLKTRMCLRKTGQFNSVIHCAQMMYREAGLHCFYRGFFMNVAGIIPYAGIELTMYEKLKSWYLKSFAGPNEYNPHPLVVPLLSSISSTCGILPTYPISLIRTKLQSKSEFTEKNINSAVGLLSTIWKTAGIRGLYRGLTASLFKVLPASGLSYVTYEHLNKKFNLQSFGSS